ncbi:hypothetical protein RUND412_004386 [Rhizina undulata]
MAVANTLVPSPPTTTAAHVSRANLDEMAPNPSDSDLISSTPAVSQNCHPENGKTHLSSSYETRPISAAPVERSFPMTDGRFFAFNFLQTSPFLGLDFFSNSRMQMEHLGEVMPPDEFLANGVESNMPEQSVIVKLVTVLRAHSFSPTYPI